SFPFPCRAQPPALLPAASRPAPPPARDDQAVKRKRAPLKPAELRLPPLVVPSLEQMLAGAPLGPKDLRFSNTLASAFQLPSPSTAPTAPRATIPPPRQFGQSNPSTPPSSASVLAPPSGDLSLRLKPAPLEPTDLGFPINLATALRLSDARPLIVAAAQARVWVAEAQLTRAKVLWVPTLMFGADYIRHDGGGPDFNKGIMTAPSVNYFQAGGGLDLSYPGAFQFLNLTDAYFEPLVARQVLNSRQADIQTAKNDSLLMTADAYFSVHQYRGLYAGALYAVELGHDLVDRISRLSKDLVPRIEVDRARNMLADLEQQATLAREMWRVHSANLTQVLRLDPRAVVVPLEHDHLQITMIDPALPLHDLQKIALTNRPELASYHALVQAAEARIRREKMRPLLPLVVIGGFQTPGGMLIQGGVFGLGPNSSLNQWVGRVDVSLQLVWQLDAFGIGNLARIKQQRGDESRTIIELRRTQDMVAADVTRAQARLQSATARVSQADRALRASFIAFSGNYEGLQQTTRFGDVLVEVFRPQEVVYALQRLKTAFDEYFTTVAEYNRAQFQMFHALGYPAGEIAYGQPPGDIEPVDTSRPAYLPRVGNGPPPATR
ncbi:MAG: TolC family protein, partial [Isosphaeraceae bacterium]